jgi:hypothetical protein
MPDTPEAPRPIEPGVSEFPTRSDKLGTSRGCLKWGLLGCAALSVVVIVGLVLLATKAKSFLESTLLKKGDEIVVRATPDVTEEQKTAFRNAYRGFVDRAKAGQLPISKMTSYTSKSDRALADGKITPEEIRELTAEVGGP